jgi:hypothetical protein
MHTHTHTGTRNDFDGWEESDSDADTDTAEGPHPLCVEFCAAIAHNKGLVKFIINCGPINATGMRMFARALQHNTTLKYLCVNEVGFEHEASCISMRHFAMTLWEFPRREFELKLTAFAQHGQHTDGDHAHMDTYTCAEIGLPEGVCFDRVMDMVDYFKRLHYAKLVAFLMGWHGRLGADSCVRCMPVDSSVFVCEAYFALPFGSWRSHVCG